MIERKSFSLVSKTVTKIRTKVEIRADVMQQQQQQTKWIKQKKE